MIVSARVDPKIVARVIGRRPLRYERAHEPLGADPAEDRPAFVRAGSSLARFAGRWVVAQDDTNVLAVLDETTGDVEPLLLPRGLGGARQFDDGRGNKAAKLDLEASVVLRRGEDEVLLLLGSGSSPAREQIVVVRERAGVLDVAVRDGTGLYARLRSLREFSGSELNVEGAACIGDRVALFQRGNGAPHADLMPVDATCSLDAVELLAFLLEGGPAPRVSDVRVFELGEVGGARLTFTDATVWGEAILYSAAAEDSPDATRDGPVAGVALGVIDRDGAARYALVRDERGAICTDKIEGIAMGESGTLLAVVDRDEPETPADLLTISITI